MLYGEIIAVCSQIHTKHINTPCGKNAELLKVKRGGTYSDQLVYKGSNCSKEGHYRCYALVSLSVIKLPIAFTVH